MYERDVSVKFQKCAEILREQPHVITGGAYGILTYYSF